MSSIPRSLALFSFFRSRRRAVIVVLLGLSVTAAWALLDVLHQKNFDYVASWSRLGGPPAFGLLKVSADKKTITIGYMGGDCDDHAEADVDETSDQVTITILISEADVDFCNAVGHSRTIAVRLSEPLAGRELVDGSRAHPE